MTTHPKIRPATRSDIEQFYGNFPWTFRAVAADLNGEVLGVGGIYYETDHVIAFSHGVDGATERFPFTAARMTIEIMKLVNGRPCIAIASDEIDGAPALLKRLGFKHIEGRVWRCRKKVQQKA